MKKSLLLIFLMVSVLFMLPNCKSKKEHEGRWRVIDEQAYEPDIVESKLFSSLDELEKLIYAPFSYFFRVSGSRSFVQEMNYKTEKELEEEKRELTLTENVDYFSDDTGNYYLSFINNRNEGYDFVWKDNFLYRRHLGGEFSKTFSMGEHSHYRETSFSSIPRIYSVLRDHAQLHNTSKKKYQGIEVTEVQIAFNEKISKRKSLSRKRYLQNLFGTEEMKDDSIVEEFAQSKKDGVSGELKIYVDNENNIVFMELDCRFNLTDEAVNFSVKGSRVLSKKAADKIEIPEYEEEYHRRTIDAAKNIMEDNQKKNKTE
jgi:hypothetical protein